MLLDVTPLYLEAILELTTCGFECIAYRNIDVFMRLFVVRHSAYSDFVAFGPDIDHNMVEPAFVLMFVRRRNGYAAADDIVAKQFKFFGVLANGSFYRI